MTKHKLEYIWLDGYQPTQSLRSKTRVVTDFSGKVADAPRWSLDGSSTEQAGTAAKALQQPAPFDL
jgi:glutamine synthetase